MSDTVSDISDSEFEEQVLKSNLPVLVDFWAPWCGPCKMLTPIVESVSEDFKERLKIVKINIDNNPDVAAKYGIRGIPTLLLFKEGSNVGTHIGMIGKGELENFINEHTE